MTGRNLWNLIREIDYLIQGESSDERKAIEYLKRYKLASSEGVNKIGNRMIRYGVMLWEQFLAFYLVDVIIFWSELVDT